MRIPLRRTDVLLGVALAVVAFAAYLPALGSGFLAFDDYDVLVNPPVEDAFVHDGSLGGLVKALSSRFNKTWLPVWTSSLWASHALWGGSPRPYHVESCLLHVLNALLVFALVRRIAGRRSVAWGAAFLFALHPAATESVAWISERKGLLAFLFSSLSFLAFLRALSAEGRRRILYHALAALLLAVAMLAKGTALVLPGILFLYVASTRWKERRWRWLLHLAPCAAVAAVLAGVHYGIALEEGPALAGGDASTLSLVATGPAVLARYLRVLVLPFWGQSLVPDVRPVAGLELRVLAGVAILSLLVAALVLAWRRDRVVFFGLASAALALAPFNNVFPRTTVLFAERYLYVSVFGVSLAAAVLLSRTRLRPILPLGAVAAALLAATVLRTSVWSDGIEVFADAERKAGGTWLTATKHADALIRAGRWEDGEAPLRRAVAAAEKPHDEAAARINLSVVLLNTGRFEEALLVLDEVPEGQLPFDRHANRAAALRHLGRHVEAAEEFRAAARSEPARPEPLVGLSSCLLEMGSHVDAREAAEEALRLDPRSEGASIALADAQYLLGELQAMRRTLVGLVQARPGSVPGHRKLGQVELELGRPRAARTEFERVQALAPRDDDARRGLADADLMLAEGALASGDREEAARLARSAADLAPDRAGAWLLLAAMAGSPDDAERLLEKAASLEDGEHARDRLASFRVRRALARAGEGDDAGAVRLVRGALRAGSRRLGLSGRLEIVSELSLLRELEEDAPGGDDLMLGLMSYLGGEHKSAEERLAEAYRSSVGARSGKKVSYLALRLRGRARLARGDRPGALDDFGVLADLAPKDPWPPLLLAETLFRGAVEQRNRALERGEEPEVTELFDGARAAAQRSLSLEPDLLDGLLLLGEVEFAVGRYFESLKVFERARREHPLSVSPMLDLASLYQTQFALTEDRVFLRGAIDELQKALALEPGNARVRAAYGKTLLLAGRADQAVAELARAVAGDPGLDEARASLAALYVKAGRGKLEQGSREGREEARRFAQRAAALSPRMAAPHVLLADLSRLTKDFAPAQVHLERAKLLEPDSPEVKDATALYHKELGFAYLLAMGKRKDERAKWKEKAYGEFWKAVEAGSENEDLRHVRILLGLEEPGAGVELDPRVAEILKERTAEARRHFERAAELEGEGDLEGALAALDDSLKARVSAEAWCRRGMIRSRQESEDEAVRCYREAIRLKPSLVEAQLNLGSILYVRGETEGALKAYEACLKHGADRLPEETRIRLEALVDQLRRSLEDD